MRSMMLVVALLGAAPAVAATVQEKVAPCLACHGENGQSPTPGVPSLGAQQEQYALIQLVMFREKMRRFDIMNAMTKPLSDDDLRAIAAFIAKLPPPKPEGGTADAARIARGKALAAQHRCNICHTPSFAGQEAVPHIADQREDYLAKTLMDYKSGARREYTPAMADVVEPLTEAQIRDLAYYLARFK